jgi:hypothetical protein
MSSGKLAKNSPRFIALPVGQGDAFFFETRSISVLVDGGKSSKFFDNIFQMYTKRKDVDILICTHNDADHANGVLGFIESGLECGEIWLPGRWAAVLPHLNQPFEEVVEELYRQSARIMEKMGESFLRNKWKLDDSLFEAYGEFLSKEKSYELVGQYEDYDMTFKERRSEDWDTGLKFIETWPEWEDIKCQLLKWVVTWELSSWQKRFLWQALEAGERIRGIAEAAYNRGITVRWFEVCHNSQKHLQGHCKIINPLNSREILRIKPCRKENLLDFLALTTSNCESLVFFVQPTDEHPAVLFTADSDLRDINLKVLDLKSAIITAPHHGSENNAYAYKQVANEVYPYENSLIWVRSDGRFSSRPGHSFLSAPGIHYCTICCDSRRQKQPVILESIKCQWISCSKKCSCQLEQNLLSRRYDDD